LTWFALFSPLSCRPGRRVGEGRLEAGAGRLAPATSWPATTSQPVAQLAGRRSPSGSRVVPSPRAASSCACAALSSLSRQQLRPDNANHLLGDESQSPRRTPGKNRNNAVSDSGRAKVAPKAALLACQDAYDWTGAGDHVTVSLSSSVKWLRCAGRSYLPGTPHC
jgi:hypothetical protein